MSMRQTPRAALCAALLPLLALCADCNGCGRSAASEPAGPAHGVAARTSGEPIAPTPSNPALQVPAAQTHEVASLAPGERRPLLIFLHGLGASGKALFDGLRLAEFGARERVFVLAPDGSQDHSGRRFWNAGAACCNLDRSDIDDVARIAALIDTWRARPDVDRARVYVVGHSNGGFMTERLVCALGDRIAAAASLAGAAPPVDLPCPRSSPLALLEVHGDADKIVRYTGGTVFDSADLAPFPAIPQGFRDWAKRLGCNGEPQGAPALDLDPLLPGAETRVDQYRACASGSVELWTVHGGAHLVGLDAQGFQSIWQFLAAHHG
jgi:polyhydroxybutyrate depolymerase